MKMIMSVDFDARFQNRPPWNGRTEFDVSPIANFIKQFQNPTTVFVREDKETIQYFGLSSFYHLVKELEGPIEIGWHPHIFDGSDVVKEENILVAELESILSESDFAQQCNLVRIGACQGGNAIMKFLASNFDVDSSAMTRCLRKDSLRWYDWSETDGRIYFPSISDYRVSGELIHDLLEVPITTINMLAPYDQSPKRRILNPSIRAEIFQKSVLDSIDYLQSLDCLVFACHAEELEEGYSNDLHSYGVDNFFCNLSFINDLFGCEYTSFEEVSNIFVSQMPKK